MSDAWKKVGGIVVDVVAVLIVVMATALARAVNDFSPGDDAREGDDT